MLFDKMNKPLKSQIVKEMAKKKPFKFAKVIVVLNAADNLPRSSLFSFCFVTNFSDVKSSLFK